MKFITTLILTIFTILPFVFNAQNVNWTFENKSFNNSFVLISLPFHKQISQLLLERQSYPSKKVNKEVFSKEVINAVISNDKALLEIKIPDNIIEAMMKIGKFIKSIMKNSDNEMLVEIIVAYVSNFSSFSIIDSILKNKKISNVRCEPTKASVVPMECGQAAHYISDVKCRYY